MTKEQFISQAENELGYISYKDLVVELGYGRRNLDRYKYEDSLNEKFVEKFNEWLSKRTQKTEEPKKEESKPKVEEKQPQQEISKPKIEKNDTQTNLSTQNETQIGIDITNEDYHSSGKLSASKLKLILENAREYQATYITKEIEQSKTDALLIGSLHHTLVLEPHKFNDEYIVLNMPSRPVKQDYIDAVEMLGGTLETRENSKKEIVVADTVDELKVKLDDLKSKTDKTIVTQAQLDIAMTTSEKALESYFVVEAGMKTLLKAKLRDIIELDNCYVEKTFYGVIDGIEIQIRPDLLVNLSKQHKVWFVVDLKTANDATMSMFAQQSSKFYYDIQEYVYREVLRQNGIDVKDFRFCVAGKSEASRSAYYQLDSEDIEDAGQMVKQIIKKYKWCKENDIWEEGKFDYQRLRFEPTATVKLPTYRKFQLIDMGVL